MPKALSPISGQLLDSWGRSNNRKHADKECEHCGTAFRPKRESSRYCSRRCTWDNNGGQNKKQESWWINPNGYVEGRITMPDGSKKRIKQHRWIMENHINRTLKEDEVVHHINGNCTDNRIENLQVMKFGEHSTYHNLKRSANKAEGKS